MSERGRREQWFDRILGVAVLVMMGAVLVQPGGILSNPVFKLAGRCAVRCAGESNIF